MRQMCLSVALSLELTIFVRQSFKESTVDAYMVRISKVAGFQNMLPKLKLTNDVTRGYVN